MMKQMGVIIIWGISILCSGCQFTVKDIQQEMQTEESQMERSTYIETNKAVILENIDIGETGAMATAQLLEQVGCTEIACIEKVEDTGKCYVVTVSDANDSEYVFTMSYMGYPGVIKNIEGEILYAPID